MSYVTVLVLSAAYAAVMVLVVVLYARGYHRHLDSLYAALAEHKQTRPDKDDIIKELEAKLADKTNYAREIEDHLEDLLKRLPAYAREIEDHLEEVLKNLPTCAREIEDYLEEVLKNLPTGCYDPRDEATLLTRAKIVEIQTVPADERREKIPLNQVRTGNGETIDDIRARIIMDRGRGKAVSKPVQDD